MRFIYILFLLASTAFGQITFGGSTVSNAKVTGTTSATPSFHQKVATFTINVLPLPNPFIFVGCSEHTWPYEQVVSVTVNGVPAVQTHNLNSIPRQANTTVWYALGVASGPATIVATTNNHNATNGYGATCVAQDYYGVSQLDPIRYLDSDNVPVLGDGDQSFTCHFDNLQSGDFLVMYEYSTGYNQLAVASAFPSAADVSSGRWFGLQIGLAHAGPFSAGDAFSETWQIHHSATGVAFSIGALILKAA